MAPGAGLAAVSARARARKALLALAGEKAPETDIHNVDPRNALNRLVFTLRCALLICPTSRPEARLVLRISYACTALIVSRMLCW